MSTMSINATTERTDTRPGRLSGVPWLTVVPLAVLLAYADGFWLIVLRLTVGSIERTQAPFMTWLLESTLVLPIFILVVIGALMLAKRWVGPVLRKPKTVVAAALMIVAASSLAGIGALAASSGYDYNLETSRPMASMPSMSTPDSIAVQNRSALALQVRSVGYGSGIILVTNLVLVGWVVALRGGRLGVSKTRK